MIRFIFRFAALILLAIAIVVAVIDISRSVAASQFIVTPLLASLESSFPQAVEAMRVKLEGIDPSLWWAASAVLSLPGVAVFAIAALLAYMIGHKKSRQRGFIRPI